METGMDNFVDSALIEKRKRLYEAWRKEESIAHIQGWDFSHISGRYTEEGQLPWDFKSVIKSYLTDEMTLLDMELIQLLQPIEWEFPYFEVDKYLDNLYKLQDVLEQDGVIEGKTHRFYASSGSSSG